MVRRTFTSKVSSAELPVCWNRTLKKTLNTTQFSISKSSVRVLGFARSCSCFEEGIFPKQAQPSTSAKTPGTQHSTQAIDPLELIEMRKAYPARQPSLGSDLLFGCLLHHQLLLFANQNELSQRQHPRELLGRGRRISQRIYRPSKRPTLRVWRFIPAFASSIQPECEGALVRGQNLEKK